MKTVDLGHVSERLRIIGEVTEKINRGRTFEEIFESLYRELKHLIPCHRLSIGFLQEDGHTLVLGPVQCDGEILLRSGFRDSIEGSSLKPLIESGRTRIINDLEEYLERKPASKSTRLIVREGMKSSLTVPLVVSDRRIGVMWFSSRDRNAYSPEHESFMRMIAGHLAIAIEKGQLVTQLERDNRGLVEANELKERFVERLNAEVSRQTAELKREREKHLIILEIAKEIHGTLDLGQVFKTLVDLLRPRLSFDRASILILSEDGRTLRFRELDPPEREHLGRESVIHIEGSAAGRAIRQGRAHYTPDLEEDSSYYEDSFLRKAGIRSRVSIPLFIQGRPIGTFNLASTRKDSFSSDDLMFLSELAEQVSVAVANSEAYLEAEAGRNRLQDENVQLREIITRSPELRELIGESPRWRTVLRQIEKVAETDATVLVRGETGTGKELIARAIHRLSPRRDKPFVAINCAILSPEFIASELFGHERGAFTGAVARKLGRVELAHHGTLFLDEVAELPGDLQAKILRVLQEREFERLGGTQTIKVDVRVLAATNRDIDRARKDGRFRDDLFYRLNVFPIHVPPLRERREDIEPLITFFLHRYAQKVDRNIERIDRRTIERCLNYRWPGNVRELENLVERSVILTTGSVFLMDPTGEMEMAEPSHSEDHSLAHAIRTRLTEVLKMTKGKIYGKRGAAEILKLKPSTLQAKLAKHGVKSVDFR